jgi:hypothetical protein
MKKREMLRLVEINGDIRIYFFCGQLVDNLFTGKYPIVLTALLACVHAAIRKQYVRNVRG